MDYVHIIGNAIFPENIFDIVSRKMNPVDFRMINAVVIITLFLFGAVQHHISCGDDLLHAMKVEMCLAGGDIQELVVYAATGTVRGELGPGQEMVGAATSYEKRVGLVLEIQSFVMPIGRISINTPAPPWKLV